ncbi:hypothetical protein V8F33_011131 [Rhypophila sp. PSN 637]
MLDEIPAWSSENRARPRISSLFPRHGLTIHNPDSDFSSFTIITNFKGQFHTRRRVKTTCLHQTVKTPSRPQNTTGFNTAWVHQLHCVYWVMREYHRVLHHGPDGSEYFIDPTHNSYRTSHC